MSSESYDIVIIGGGLAGLVVASRLSEDPDLQVAVIESGGDHRDEAQVLTPGMWPLLINSPMDWAFQTVQQPGFTGNYNPTFPQGRALGGSTAINSFLFFPTSKANVDAWAQLGNKGWEYSEFEKAVLSSCTIHAQDGTTKGNGPIQLAVHASEPQDTWRNAWSEALSSLGFPECDPFRGDVCGSLRNLESVYPATKQRCYSGNAYLEPARTRSNLTVLTDCTVTKIILSKSTPDAAVAEGVQFTTSTGGTKVVKARKEVVLSAGAINSPRLLELSGIGNADFLQKLGIDVVVDNPQVGENLQNHPFTGVSFEVRDDVETLDPFLRSEPGPVAAAMEAYAKGTGPLGTSNVVSSAQLPFPGNNTEEGQKEVNQLLRNLNTEADAARDPPANPAFVAAHESFVRSVLTSPTESSATYLIGPAYSAFEGSDPRFRAPGNHCTVIVMLSHPLSRGSVHITSASPEHTSTNEGLAIDPRYFSHPLDIEVLARHVRFAEESIGRAEPLARYFKPRAARFDSQEKAKEYVRRTGRGAHHFTGTCSMLPRATGGVVDEKLRVYGVANLRVCDSSIIPIEPRSNIQAVVYGVAEMGAKLIKETL